MSDTALTIIGMIAAFITASVTSFLAEPVKNYVENRIKLRNLRIALYKELINNYYALTAFTVSNQSDFFTPEYVARHELRTECYKQTLQDELTLFYQLVEANMVNVLYGRTNQIINLKSDLTNVFGKRGLKKAPAFYIEFSNTFIYMFVTAFYIHTFDTRVLKRLVKPEQYKEIISKGKEETLKFYNESPKTV